MAGLSVADYFATTGKGPWGLAGSPAGSPNGVVELSTSPKPWERINEGLWNAHLEDGTYLDRTHPAPWLLENKPGLRTLSDGRIAVPTQPVNPDDPGEVKVWNVYQIDQVHGFIVAASVPFTGDPANVPDSTLLAAPELDLSGTNVQQWAKISDREFGLANRQSGFEDTTLGKVAIGATLGVLVGASGLGGALFDAAAKGVGLGASTVPPLAPLTSEEIIQAGKNIGLSETEINTELAAQGFSTPPAVPEPGAVKAPVTSPVIASGGAVVPVVPTFPVAPLIPPSLYNPILSTAVSQGVKKALAAFFAPDQPIADVPRSAAVPRSADVPRSAAVPLASSAINTTGATWFNYANAVDVPGAQPVGFFDSTLDAVLPPFMSPEDLRRQDTPRGTPNNNAGAAIVAAFFIIIGGAAAVAYLRG